MAEITMRKFRANYEVMSRSGPTRGKLLTKLTHKRQAHGPLVNILQLGDCKTKNL